jgi:hypothetical protein
MSLQMRYASSGPFIENAEGGIASPGEGFRLRLTDFNQSLGTFQMGGGGGFVPLEYSNPDTGAEVLTLQFENASPSLRYRMGLLLPIEASLDASFSINASYSVDGVTYLPQPDALDSWMFYNSIPSQSILVSYTSRLVLGSDLGLVTQGTLYAQFITQLGLNSAFVKTGFSVFATLEETL